MIRGQHPTYCGDEVNTGSIPVLTTKEPDSGAQDKERSPWMTGLLISNIITILVV